VHVKFQIHQERNMRLNPLALAALAVVFAGPVALGQVVITEIHYNPAGSESAAQEWVEIYNPTAGTIDLSGWSWGDSQDNVFTGPFAAGTFLAPGEAAVLLFQSPAEFATMWGSTVKVIPTDIGISLANAGSATNETVAVRDASGTTVDEVNYETNTNGWPNTAQGRSIYLLPTGVSTTGNDIGTNWALSTDGVDGAFTALAINPAIANATFADIASPGFVAVANTPAFVLGDFNFDGGVDASDIDVYVLAANEGGSFDAFIASAQEAFGSLYSGQILTADIVNQIGDINGDGGLDSSDIDPFVPFANNGGARVSAIPEPAALGLLAPAALLIGRRRR
jgi:hypothetical protein